MEFKFAELPSRGILIDQDRYESLIVSKPGLKQLSLFSQAVTNNNPTNFADGVALLLNIPLKQLSMGDFFFIITYLRCTAFKHTPLSLTWICDGYWYTRRDSTEIIKASDARKMVEDEMSEHARLLPNSCNTTNSQEFSFDDIGKVYLPDEVQLDTDTYAIPNAGLYAEYVRLAKDAAMRELLPSVQWIKAGDTLKQKLEWLEQQGDRDLDIFDQASRYNEAYTHGVSNVLIGTCTKCGTQVQQKFELTAESFFRGS